MLSSRSIGVPRRSDSHCPHVPFTRWVCRDISRAVGICRESRLGARRRPREGPFRTGLLLVASSLGAGSCPVRASRLPPGPGLSFADRLARKLSACLVPSAVGSMVLGRAPVVGPAARPPEGAPGRRAQPSRLLSIGAAGWGASCSRARPPRAGQLAFFRFFLPPPPAPTASSAIEETVTQ